jgi:hypothetical protein
MCTPSCYMGCSRHRKCEFCAQTSGDIGFAPAIVFGRSLHSPIDNCIQIVWKEIKKNLQFNNDLSNIIKLYLYINKNIKLLVRYQYNIDIDTHHDLRLYRSVFEKKKKSFKPLDVSIKKSFNRSKNKKYYKSSNRRNRSKRERINQPRHRNH